MVNFIILLYLVTLGGCCTRYEIEVAPDDIKTIALALPPQPKKDRLAKLKEFLATYPEEFEFYITDKGRPKAKYGWELLPFKFEKFRIYGRRVKRFA